MKHIGRETIPSLRKEIVGDADAGETLGTLRDDIPDFSTIPEYADDAAAGTGGLTAGQLYRTAAGALMVKL